MSTSEFLEKFERLQAARKRQIAPELLTYTVDDGAKAMAYLEGDAGTKAKRLMEKSNMPKTNSTDNTAHPRGQSGPSKRELLFLKSRGPFHLAPL